VKGLIFNMSNALAIYSKIDNPLVAAEKMALPCAKVCGAKSQEEGYVIALTCMIEGITPIDFMRKYHIIQGKPSMRADALLAGFRQIGGRHKLVECSPNRAAVEMTWEGQTHQFVWTWEEAQESRWPWKDPSDHKEGLKDNWSTPEDRENMLWARLISKSLRRICPELCSGIYTPEEMEDVASTPAIVTSQPVAAPVDAKALLQAKAAKESQQEAPKDETVVDAEFTVVTDEPDQQDPPFDMPPDAKGSITAGQASALVGLFSSLAVSESNQKDAFAKRGVQSMSELSKNQADDMIAKLEAAKAQRGKR
jgi:hypothetical protein